MSHYNCIYGIQFLVTCQGGQPKCVRKPYHADRLEPVLAWADQEANTLAMDYRVCSVEYEVYLCGRRIYQSATGGA